MQSFLKLIQWQYVLAIIITLVIVKYGLLLPAETQQRISTALTPLQFAMACLALALINAAGFVITAIYKEKADRINAPKNRSVGLNISENNSFTIFISLTLLGVVLGYYLCYTLNSANLFTLFVVLSALWYINASALQQMPVIGTVISGLIFGLQPLIVGVLELYPAINIQNSSAQLFFLDLILDIAIYIALLSFIKYSITNLKDVDGHFNAGWQTLPITIGRNRAKKIISFASLVPILTIMFYVGSYLNQQIAASVIIIICIVLPLMFASYLLFTAQTKQQLTRVIQLYNAALMSTSLCVLLYKFFILN